MNTPRRAVAGLELLLVFPAALFMAALFVRNISPDDVEPARTALRIVAWYTGLPPGLGLWLLLMALPLGVFLLGCTTLLLAWTNDGAFRQAARDAFVAIRAHLATVVIAAATAAAGGILAVVAVHALTN